MYVLVFSCQPPTRVSSAGEMLEKNIRSRPNGSSATSASVKACLRSQSAGPRFISESKRK